MNREKNVPIVGVGNVGVGKSLTATDLHLSFESTLVFSGLNVSVPENQFSVIVGPNGCGKSTLLRTLCRLQKPQKGRVELGGENIHNWDPRHFAREVGLLPQRVQAPDGIRVVDLVARGRYPHQSLFKQWSQDDEQAVREAMRLTQTAHLAERMVEELSGGQRQRVWIAMVLAQQTPILFLDEPTTYLDMAHQIELLELFSELNRNRGYTIVAVLHDLNQACRYAQHIIMMKAGEIVNEQVLATDEAITEKVIKVIKEKPEIVRDTVEKKNHLW